MDLGLEGRKVLVTGASRGIGAGIAQGFGEAGCQVAVHYKANVEGAREVVEHIRAEGADAESFRADLTLHKECKWLVDKVVEEFGGIDVLVNNAGDIVRRAPIVDFELDDFEALWRLNVASVFQLCKLVAIPMKHQGHGVIVNVSSASARNGGGPGAVAYAASKAAVSTMSRGMAKELAGSGIRVNTLAPGLIDTDIHNRHGIGRSLKSRAESVPLGRAGNPRDCAGAALFLASPVLSAYITGQSLEVNGGTVMP